MTNTEQIQGKTDKADWFDRFWAAYPNKKAKGEAKKNWDKLNPDQDLAWQIVFAVDAQKKWRQREKGYGRFIPEWKHPATWLNQQCWLDEIPSAQTAKAASEARTCRDCKLKADIFVGQDGYCTRHYRNRFSQDREQIYEICKRIGMQKRADESAADYFARCREWCFSHKNLILGKIVSRP